MNIAVKPSADLFESEEFKKILNEELPSSLSKRTPNCNCLLALLDLKGWDWHIPRLMEELPHFSKRLELLDAERILNNLGFKTEVISGTYNNLPVGTETPLLYIDKSGAWRTIVKEKGDKVALFDGSTLKTEWWPKSVLKGWFISLEAQAEETRDLEPKRSIASFLYEKYKKELRSAAFYSIISGFFGLSVPIFVLAIFEQAIPSRSAIVFITLFAGIALGLAIEHLAKQARSVILNRVGAQASFTLINQIYGHLIHLPMVMLEATPVPNQFARLHLFDEIRRILTRPNLISLFDIPFLIFGFLLLLLLSPVLAAVMGTGLALLGVLLYLSKRIRPANAGSLTLARAKLNAHISQFVLKMRNIQSSSLGEGSINRLNRLVDFTEEQQLTSGATQTRYVFLAQMIQSFTSLALMITGVFLVLYNNLSLGVLIASSAVVFRVMASASTIFQAALSARSLKAIFDQAENLKNQSVQKFDEPEDASKKVLMDDVKGRMEFTQVSHRYHASGTPSLLGVNLSIMPGEFVGIVGDTGSGKTTLFKIIMGMIAPTSGQLLLDGYNAQQINLSEFRKQISYLPQRPQFFYGTVFQNLQLANPMATTEEIAEVCEKLGLTEEIKNLPQQADTVIGDFGVNRVSTSFLKMLNYAQCLLKDPTIILLDRACQFLDRNSIQYVWDELAKLKGQKTVIIGADDENDLLGLCDRAIWMDRGSVVASGKTEDVVKAYRSKTSIML